MKWVIARAALLCFVALVGCSHTQKATITLGAGDSDWKECNYESFQADHDFGIFELVENPLDIYRETPTQGATISGDLAGFGRRTIHNDSDNKNLEVNVVYHATTYQATLDRMGQLNCFQ